MAFRMHGDLLVRDGRVQEGGRERVGKGGRERVVSVSELEIAMDQPSDVLVMAAAVSDFTLENPSAGKLKRTGSLELTLTATKDLVAGYAAKHPNSYVVGFALVERNGDVEEAAKQKLAEKKLQLVVGNSIDSLGSPDTSVLVVSPGDTSRLTGSKSEVAKSLVAFISSAVSV